MANGLLSNYPWRVYFYSPVSFFFIGSLVTHLLENNIFRQNLKMEKLLSQKFNRLSAPVLVYMEKNYEI